MFGSAPLRRRSSKHSSLPVKDATSSAVAPSWDCQFSSVLSTTSSKQATSTQVGTSDIWITIFWSGNKTNKYFDVFVKICLNVKHFTLHIHTVHRDPDLLWWWTVCTNRLICHLETAKMPKKYDACSIDKRHSLFLYWTQEMLIYTLAKAYKIRGCDALISVNTMFMLWNVYV